MAALRFLPPLKDLPSRQWQTAETPLEYFFGPRLLSQRMNACPVGRMMERSDAKAKGRCPSGLTCSSRRNYSGYMLKVKLARIGNSRGLRLPAALIRKHQLERGIVIEDRADEIVLRPAKPAKKLAWEETAREMA